MTAYTQLLGRHPQAQPHGNAPCSETALPATETLIPLRGQARSFTIEKCLSKKSLLRLAGDHRGENIACLAGVIWLTQSGNPEDILLCTGESFPITRKGALLIEGLAAARLVITRHATGYN